VTRLFDYIRIYFTYLNLIFRQLYVHACFVGVMVLSEIQYTVYAYISNRGESFLDLWASTNSVFEHYFIICFISKRTFLYTTFKVVYIVWTCGSLYWLSLLYQRWTLHLLV